jgi:hypothetical protein
MKKMLCPAGLYLCLATVLIVSCSAPVGLTSWKNPKASDKVSKIAFIAMFDKLTYIQPFEEQFAGYFKSQNLDCIKSLDFLEPFRKYSNADLQKKLDSLGADGILLLSYKGTDISVDVNSGYYGGYFGWWGGAGGGWSTTSTVNLRARLYPATRDGLIWSADLTVTDPSDINKEALQIARVILADFQKNNLLKNPPPPPPQKK